MPKSDFFDVPRTTTYTSQGRVDLPMLFYDVSVRHLNYFVGYNRVLPKLEGTGMVPCKFFNGKALVSLIFYNYRDVSIGGYDEVTITIVVRPLALKDPKIYVTNFLKKKGEKWNNIGAYVLEMPVTIPAARAAGREIWGYPKFVTKIPYKLAGNYFEFEVLDPDTQESIVSVKGAMGAGISMPAFDLVTYSNLNDSILKTIIDVDGNYKTCMNKGVTLKAGSSKHGMAKNVRDLGLENIQPFAIQTCDSYRTRLNAGKPISPWKTPPLPYPPK